MKKYFILIIFIFLVSPFFSTYAENKIGWEFVKDVDYCYIKSTPIITEIPKGKSRGKYYMLVYRLNKSPESIIQITAGFNFKTAESVDVKIDNNSYSFYADEDTAWANDDKKVVGAMIKGLKMIVTSISNKETKIIDTYTLKGFTAAFNKLSKDC